MLVRTLGTFPLIQLPRKSEVGIRGFEKSFPGMFPLIQLPRKSEAADEEAQLAVTTAEFPLIQLPRKSEVNCFRGSLRCPAAAAGFH